MRKPAFSILELIVAVTVVGILASIVATNFGDSRVRARDANRRLAVGQYSASMDQWKAARGSYFVEGDGGCVLDRGRSNDYGAFGAGAGCTGYRGGSIGQMTRIYHSVELPNYQVLSIAQALLQKGYLTRITTDPLDRTYQTKSTRDYILTICDDNSYVSKTKESSVQFAVFARLERPKSDEPVTASQHCGGPETDHGWDTLEYTR